MSEKSSAEVAKDLGAHPFALSKLAPRANKMSPSDAKQLLALFIEADATLKSSAHNPWLLIERALLKVSLLGRA
jgi:DNA polymerase III delta subunit